MRCGRRPQTIPLSWNEIPGRALAFLFTRYRHLLAATKAESD